MVTSLRPKPGPPRNYHFPNFHDQILPSGIRLVTASVAKLPVVTVLIIVDAGSTNDPGGKEGVAALTAGALLEGSQRFDGAELAEKFEQLGTSVESGADWDSAFIKITVLSDQLEEATMLLGEAISSPVFPQREVERAKAERLAEILQLETEPRGLADEKFSEFLYTQESRYSKPDEGSTESVSALSRRDVEEFYRSRYRAESTANSSGSDDPEEHSYCGQAGGIAVGTSSWTHWFAAETSRLFPDSCDERSSGRSLRIADQPESPRGARLYVWRFVILRLASWTRSIRRIDGRAKRSNRSRTARDTSRDRSNPR